MMHVFAFHDPNGREILKSHATFLFQVKARQPCTVDDDIASKTMESAWDSCIYFVDFRLISSITLLIFSLVYFNLF